MVAASSRDYNEKSSLDIIRIPHWTWNYSSTQRVPYRLQLARRWRTEKHPQSVNNVTLMSLDEALDRENPFIENHDILEDGNCDFVSHPMVIPLPYGVREKCLCFSPIPDIVFVGTLRVCCSLHFISFHHSNDLTLFAV